MQGLNMIEQGNPRLPARRFEMNFANLAKWYLSRQMDQSEWRTGSPMATQHSYVAFEDTLTKTTVV